MRQALVDRIWHGLLVMVALGTPASLLRSLYTGWLPVYSFHLAVALLVLVVHWFRARVSFAVKSALLLLILWSIGLAGVFTFGILGTGYWWLVLSSLLVSTLYSMRAGILSAVAVTATLAAAGAAFVSGALEVPLDANAYIVSGSAWAALLVATLVTPFIVFQAIAAYHQTTLDLLHEVHKQRDQIQQLATHDQLTGLPLSSLVGDRLQVALHATRRTRLKVALLFLDLDDFKSVNDALGHEAGDHVLKEVAARLLKAIRAGDTAGRVGGDEFVLILGGLPDDQVAARIAQRAIGAVSAPIDYAGASTSVGASIGIGLFPDHADDGPALRREADAAMYAAKRMGKNRFALAEREKGTSPDPSA